MTRLIKTNNTPNEGTLTPHQKTVVKNTERYAVYQFS